MSNFQPHPIKLYIQDIYRAKRTAENKYIYELFGLTFKNVMLHGVVTLVYNTTRTATNFELTDPTGTIQIYYDITKSNINIKDDMMKSLNSNFTSASKFGDVNLMTMAWMLDKIKKKKLDIHEGSYVSVVGDIFVDDKEYRMISGFNCVVTSADRDIVWLEELRYLYDKFYLWSKE